MSPLSHNFSTVHAAFLSPAPGPFSSPRTSPAGVCLGHCGHLTKTLNSRACAGTWPDRDVAVEFATRCSEWLCKHEGSADVQRAACNALRFVCASLSHNREARQAAVPAVGAVACRSVIAALRTHAVHADVQTAGCGALREFAFGCVPNKLLAGERGALETALLALKLNRGSAAVQEQARRPRAAGLRSAPYRRAWGAIWRLTWCHGPTAPRSHGPIPRLQACLVLWNCCANCPENKRRAAAAPGVADMLLAAMRAFPSEAPVQEAACGALATLAMDPEFAAAAGAAGAVQAVTATLRGSLASKEVADAACRALAALLADTPANAQRAVAEQAAKVLQQARAAHKAREGVMASTEVALQAIGASPGSSPARALGTPS